MTPLHRFLRRQLWRVAGLLAALLVLCVVFGAGPALLIAEWTPMAVSAALVAAHAARLVRARSRGRRS